jgi:hypothetical protein
MLDARTLRPTVMNSFQKEKIYMALDLRREVAEFRPEDAHTHLAATQDHGKMNGPIAGEQAGQVSEPSANSSESEGLTGSLETASEKQIVGRAVIDAQ